MKLLWKIEDALTMVLLAVIVLCVFVAAVMRWFGIPLIWSVDFATMLFIWVAILGANKALREGHHVGVDVIVRHFPLGTRIGLDLFFHLLIAIFILFLTWYGVELVQLNSERLHGTSGLSYSWITAAIPVGFSLMFITNTAHAFSLIKILLTSDKNKVDFSPDHLQKYIRET